MQLTRFRINIATRKMLTQVLNHRAADLMRVHNDELPDVVLSLENPMCLPF